MATVYRKPTFSGVYTNFDSFLPNVHRLGMMYTLAYWCFKNCSYWKKSHTCEEGDEHLRTSFWHLLMNLKSKYLLKNSWSGPIKNKIILIFTMLHLKKIKKNTWKYHYFTPVYQKSQWYDLPFLTYRVWHTKIGNFRSFFAVLPH